MESTKDVCGEAEGRPEREQQRYLQGRLQVASKSLAICRVSVSRNVSLSETKFSSLLNNFTVFLKVF